jgi:hypothetical protein
MRPDRDLLLDMLGAAHSILQFVEEMTLIAALERLVPPEL